jgi:hypothetical protein
MLKMPKLKAFENGSFEITEANGWKQVYPPNEEITSMVTVFEHETEEQLTVTCASLETGAKINLDLVIPLQPIIHEELYTEVPGGDNDDESGVEDILAHTVQLGLDKLQVRYDTDYENV